MTRISKDEYYLDIAAAVTKRSTCLKRNYGAVLVKNDEIIATGYNGAPRGEKNCCDRYDVCPRLNAAHNGTDYGDCHSVHAEMNVMLSAARKDMIGSTLYLVGYENASLFDDHRSREIIGAIPCPICARMIRNSGITRVVTRGNVVTGGHHMPVVLDWLFEEGEE